MGFGSGGFGSGGFGGGSSGATPPSSTVLVGQDLINMANARLAGYQNGVDSEALLSYLNEGKDEIWAILKNLNEEYFVVGTQSSDNTASNFFGTIDPATRQYTLPEDLREIKFIEVTTPGYTEMEFIYKDITDSDFRNARRAASTQNDAGNRSCEIYYTMLGKDQFVMAQFVPAAMDLLIWYVRAIGDFEADQQVDEVVYPFTKKISDYAVKKALLSLQSPELFAAWVSEWKQDVITVQNSAAGRNQSDPVFTEDFLG